MKILKHQQKAAKGFSLIEVMFALFLVVMVIGIASKVASNATRNTTLVKESTFARWVALNQLDLYQMAVETGSTEPPVSGEEVMGNTTWRWEREVLPSNAAILLEVRMHVYASDSRSDEPVVTVKGYIKADSNL